LRGVGFERRDGEEGEAETAKKRGKERVGDGERSGSVFGGEEGVVV